MPPDRELIGRLPELSLFAALCDRLGEGGSALLVEGDPGLGKTALTEVFERRAREQGMRVLRTAGTSDESAAPFSGLHLLLQPLRDGIPDLPQPQRDALDLAFGVRAGDLPTTFLAGVAVLTLLTDAARTHPVLVIVEDLHWLDPSSRQTLLMVARRVSSDPVIVVMTTREAHDAIEAPEIERIHLMPLSFIDANALLDTRADSPGGADRRMLLEFADGNPLALVELPIAGDRAGDRAGDVGIVPVTHRLELAFAGRYAELPRPARLGVLAGALGCDSIEDATNAVAGTGERAADWLDAAVAAGLVQSVHGRIGFRHPLVRSAVTSSADPHERSTVLRSLVAGLADPARTVWWRSDLAAGPDEQLADELARIGDAGFAAGDACWWSSIKEQRRSSRAGTRPHPRSSRCGTTNPTPTSHSTAALDRSSMRTCSPWGCAPTRGWGSAGVDVPVTLGTLTRSPSGVPLHRGRASACCQLILRR